MKRFLRTVIVMVITIAVIIGIFWFILPATGVVEEIGPAYMFVALIGSLIVSYFVSWGLNAAMSKKRKKRR